MARARAVAFVGPALRNPVVPADVDIRPPARRGDVLRAVEEGVRLIGLIDGILIGDLAVSPAELRESHARGARIVGGASLGAIRAVECPGAVEGVGEVYAAFRDGVLADDDELVGTFDDQYRYLAFPLVIVRDRCAELVRDGAMSADERDRAIAIIKELPFFERTLAGLRRSLARAGRVDSHTIRIIEDSLRSTSDDIKARDARVVLSLLA
jgi:TfuA protein